jgi:hypothetical protein
MRKFKETKLRMRESERYAIANSKCLFTTKESYGIVKDSQKKRREQILSYCLAI